MITNKHIQLLKCFFFTNLFLLSMYTCICITIVGGWFSFKEIVFNKNCHVLTSCAIFYTTKTHAKYFLIWMVTMYWCESDNNFIWLLIESNFKIYVGCHGQL